MAQKSQITLNGEIKKVQRRGLMDKNETLESHIKNYQKKDNSHYRKVLAEINSFHLKKRNPFFQYDLSTSIVEDNNETYTNNELCLE